MPYEISLMAPAEREASIAKALKSPIRTLPFHHFRAKLYELPIIRVPIDMPVYRMENFRTYTDQHEHIAKERLTADYFLNGQEIESVQQVQHDILAKLSRRGVADSVVPVIDVLKQDGQTDPLLATATGVIVNGNRRLAGMRELGLPYVELMILPADASANEIVDIEASLQGVPETKLDYDWIGDGQLINRLIGMGRLPKQVADQLHRPEKEIKNARQALIEADLYLKEWAKAEGEYGRVSEYGEQLFKDIPKRLEGKSTAEMQASRVIAWSLYDNREKLGARLYSFNAAFGNLANDVLERMAVALDLPMTSPPSDGAPVDDDDDFAIDLDDDEDVLSFDAVIAALSEDDTRADAVKALIDAVITSIEVAKGQKDGEAALKAVTEANAKLVSIDLSRASKSTYDAIGKQLNTIEALVQKLQTKLTELS
ncbi:hypothetical protein [Sphingomonas sp.]|uniref:hypothetical protein n=1 Tax=Sphingomonas sp. TaxID=28214 RepID=UPI003F709B7D